MSNVRKQAALAVLLFLSSSMLVFSSMPANTESRVLETVQFHWPFPPFPQPFTVDFVYNASRPITGQVVNFTAIGANGVTPYHFSWNFSDGSTSQSRIVMHSFAMTGSYRVVLTGRDSAGTVLIVVKTVQVAPPPLAVSFTASPQAPAAGTRIIFQPSVSGGLQPYAVLWDFGDHHTENKTRAGHTYYAAGNYTVTLTVRDAYGQTATTSKSVQVTPFVPIQTPQNQAGNTQQTDTRSGVDLLASPGAIAAVAVLTIAAIAAVSLFLRRPLWKIRK